MSHDHAIVVYGWLCIYSSNGRIVFSSGFSGVFIGDGLTTQPIAVAATATDGFADNPGINNHGTVIFGVRTNNGAQRSIATQLQMD